jgi:uncharacterized protein (DUF885 family)
MQRTAAVLLLSTPLLASQLAAQTPATPPAQLDQLAADTWEARAQIAPVNATTAGDHRYNHVYTAFFSEQTRSLARADAEAVLGRLRTIDREALDEERRATYDLLQWRSLSTLEESRFPGHLSPLNPSTNFVNAFAQLGSGRGGHPFRTVDDYEDFLSRIDGFVTAVDEAIGNMREGMAKGIVQPRVLVEPVIPQLEAHVVGDPEGSVLYGAVREIPASFAPADRERLTAAYRAAIRDRFVPAVRRLLEFTRGEYLPATRSSVGLGAIPGGREWFGFQVRRATTTSLTPDQIHEIGLAEVARLQGEIERVKARVGFRGTLREFFEHVRTDPALNYSSREEMLADARNAKARIDASTDRLFAFRPRADYEIRPVPPSSEQSAGAGVYQVAALDGSRPGILTINTYEPQTRSRTMLTSFLLHEGSPGHHFQRSMTREQEHLPQIRRFPGGEFTAYGEGWALYAETLGRELGVMEDPYQYYGLLSGELMRAIWLVVETGIHAKGWTREQAMGYTRSNSSQGEPSMQSQFERFIALPGVSLAYAIGEMRIAELRRRAEAALGPRFDVKEFHSQVLLSGALPLDVLEAKIDRWIQARTARPQ